MADVRIARTEELTHDEFDRIRHIVRLAFDSGFDEHDWQHALGGHHAIVTVEGEIASHAAVVDRKLWVGQRSVRAGYVEGVATVPAKQGCGLGTIAMSAIAGVIAQHHQLGALSTGEWHFYERLGWRRWAGPTFVRRVTGTLLRTPDEDSGIMVLSRSALVDCTASIACSERSGDDW